ncbi:MAG: AraC family transcriptional regulator [Hungatella sp.]|nr:AraC family transcriptional regulator [Hungatella sp.]
MIKLLIVDDEPLVQIGIKSMLNWAEYGIEVCGTAMNGAAALDLIEEYSPEIVITDIRMPIMNGLELAKICRDTYGRIPLFIILTSYEEFELARQALSYEVIDYLVKLELDAPSLGASIQNALKKLNDIRSTEAVRSSGRPLLQTYLDKFFLRLLHNLFDNEEQFWLQVKDLNLNFSHQYYAAAHCEILEGTLAQMTHEKLMSLYASTLQMVRDILNRHMPCQVISLDMKHFSAVFHFPSDSDESQQKIAEALENAGTMVHNYFNVKLTAGIGSVVDSPLKISDSYQDARMAFSLASGENPYPNYNQVKPDSIKNSFNITLFKNDLTRAFEEFDSAILHETLTQIIDLFRQNPLRYLQAIDGACNILYLALSLLPGGEETISAIFREDADGYRSIYRMGNVEQVTDWMTRLRDGLCDTLKTKRMSYKENVVSSVQKYIQNHIEERLTLNEVAAVFGLSPNYLSVLFKKTCNVGFSEYITQMKISRAKAMLLEQDMKVYEVADRLSFESAFYFSKVFKKVTGCSPREFVQHNVDGE